MFVAVSTTNLVILALYDDSDSSSKAFFSCLIFLVVVFIITSISLSTLPIDSDATCRAFVKSSELLRIAPSTSPLCFPAIFSSNRAWSASSMSFQTLDISNSMSYVDLKEFVDLSNICTALPYFPVILAMVSPNFASSSSPSSDTPRSLIEILFNAVPTTSEF